MAVRTMVTAARTVAASGIRVWVPSRRTTSPVPVASAGTTRAPERKVGLSCRRPAGPTAHTVIRASPTDHNASSGVPTEYAFSAIRES